MNLLNFLNIQSTWNLKAIKGEILKEKLNDFIYPQFDDFGLSNWDKNYQWSGDFNENGIKHVLEFVSLKDNQGTFLYGNVYNFIPVLSVDGKILSKSKRLQLYERADDRSRSFEKRTINPPNRISLWNEYFFKKSMLRFLEKETETILLWYSNNRTLEQNIQSTIVQIERGGSYEAHMPDQKFILAFLFAKNGEKELAEKTLYDYYRPLLKKNTSKQPEYEKMNSLISRT